MVKRFHKDAISPLNLSLYSMGKFLRLSCLEVVLFCSRS